VELLCERLDQLVPGDHPYREQIRFVADRPGHDFRYAIDASKIENGLGWRPETSFASGIDQTIRWYLDHRGWCDRIRSGEYRRYYEQQYRV
jgi:dTDP-glucose 4,6-dehydratase